MSDTENILIKQIYDFHKEFRDLTTIQLQRLEDVTGKQLKKLEDFTATELRKLETGQNNLLQKIETLAKVSEVSALEQRIKDLEEFKWKAVGIVTACQVFISISMFIVNSYINK